MQLVERVKKIVLGEIMAVLKRTKLVFESTDGHFFFPARDPEQIEIKEILDAARMGGEPERSYRSHEGRDAVDDLLHELNESVAVALKGKNLKTLVLAMTREPTT